VSVRQAGELLKRARVVREHEHRLKPSLRLKAQSDMVKFIHERGLVSVLGGNELPSMIGAVLGGTWRPSSKGFKGWLDWWSLKIDGQRLSKVFGEIERRKDILASRVFRQSKTFVSIRLWPILDTIVQDRKRSLTKGKVLSPLDLRILSAVESEGSIRTDQLRKKMKLEGKQNNYRFHRALANLENNLLIVGAEDPNPERHMHANIWQTWNKRTAGVSARTKIPIREASKKLIEKTIDSCVLVQEDNVQDLYPWKENTMQIVEDLLSEGTVIRAGRYLVPSRIIEPN
jgi:hypothetical protein